MSFSFVLSFKLQCLVHGKHFVSLYDMMEMNGMTIFKDNHFFLSKILFLDHLVAILTFKRERLVIIQTELIYDDSYLEGSMFQVERSMRIFSCKCELLLSHFII